VHVQESFERLNVARIYGYQAEQTPEIVALIGRGAVAFYARHSVRNVGVENWAWRKEQDDRTILSKWICTVSRSFGPANLRFVCTSRPATITILRPVRRRPCRRPDRAPESSPMASKASENATINRNWCGIYAEGATFGASQSQQIADRFHLVFSATIKAVTGGAHRQMIAGRVLTPTQIFSGHCHNPAQSAATSS
jgi:hypothetical protein